MRVKAITENAGDRLISPPLLPLSGPRSSSRSFWTREERLVELVILICATGGRGEGKGTAAATKQDREVEAFVQAGLPTYKGEFESVAEMIDQMVADVKVLDGRDPDRQV